MRVAACAPERSLRLSRAQACLQLHLCTLVVLFSHRRVLEDSLHPFFNSASKTPAAVSDSLPAAASSERIATTLDFANSLLPS